MIGHTMLFSLAGMLAMVAAAAPPPAKKSAAAGGRSVLAELVTQLGRHRERMDDPGGHRPERSSHGRVFSRHS